MSDNRVTVTYVVNCDTDTAIYPDLVLRQTIRQLATSYLNRGMSLDMFKSIVKIEADNIDITVKETE